MLVFMAIIKWVQQFDKVASVDCLQTKHHVNDGKTRVFGLNGPFIPLTNIFSQGRCRY